MKAKVLNKTKVITGKVRASYAHIFAFMFIYRPF
ncbi:hypothetical protein V326_02701 [Staphylococcus aureus F29447]|nr:hypothetical protein V326_02701 [Staphylococcus aureus F29447]